MNTCDLVPGLGVEPRLLGPEPSVLPLDDPGINYGVSNSVDINLFPIMTSWLGLF